MIRFRSFAGKYVTCILYCLDRFPGTSSTQRETGITKKSLQADRRGVLTTRERSEGCEESVKVKLLSSLLEKVEQLFCVEDVDFDGH